MAERLRVYTVARTDRRSELAVLALQHLVVARSVRDPPTRRCSMPTSLTPDPNDREWTKDDFKRAKGPETLPAEVLAAFPNTVARLARTRGLGRKPR